MEFWDFATIVIWLFFFAKFFQNYKAKLTENELLTSLYNEIKNFNNKNFASFSLGNSLYVCVIVIVILRKFIIFNKIDNFLITNIVFREMTKFLIGMQVLTNAPTTSYWRVKPFNENVSVFVYCGQFHQYFTCGFFFVRKLFCAYLFRFELFLEQEYLRICARKMFV